MATEPNRTLEAIKIATSMEDEGKKYYLKTSQESSNALGKKLLHSLALEEDIHRQKFMEIYEAVRNKKGWPSTDFQPDGGKRLRTIFIGSAKKTDSNTKVPTTELDAVQIAIGMETKTFDFYKSQAQNATYDSEGDFYEVLAGEEREHHLILLDYYEYLKDPASWFVNQEHPTLDGG